MRLLDAHDNRAGMSRGVEPRPPSLDTARLARIAAGLASSSPHDLLEPGRHRRWARVEAGDGYEAWVIAWPPATGLGMHDHGGSAAAVHVLDGELRERFVGHDGRVAVRWLHAGDTVELDERHVHEVVNLGRAEVVSVHVYSPPLADDDFRLDAELSFTPAPTSTRAPASRPR